MKNRAYTEQKLIDAVNRIIRNEGVSSLGVNKVAKEAGVSKCLIYRYFGSFEHLLRSSSLEKDDGLMFMPVLLF